jgi:hypothetical protein
MEFTFKVTEAEYLRASRLKIKLPGSKTLQTVLFWIFILICLVSLWSNVEKSKRTTVTNDQPVVTQPSEIDPPSHGTGFHALLVNVGPFFLLIGVWFFMLLKLRPTTVRGLYRKDPVMQGQFTVNVTPEFLSAENTAGTFWKARWNIFAAWREGKDVIVLMYFTGAYFVLSIAGLSDAQRSELRGILATALPKK